MDVYEPIISKDPSDVVMSDTVSNDNDNNKKTDEKKSRCLSCMECCECFGSVMNSSACCCLSAGLFLMSLGSSR